MKLQKQLGKKMGGKVYHKYVVVIPPEIIEKSEFKEGDNLEADASKYHIIIKKKL